MRLTATVAARRLSGRLSPWCAFGVDHGTALDHIEKALEEFAAGAVLEERERCAKVCEDLPRHRLHQGQSHIADVDFMAGLIRRAP